MRKDDAMRNSESSEFFKEHARSYISDLTYGLNEAILDEVSELANKLRKVWKEKGTVYICGNGGSAANAIHIANDLHYGSGACGTGPEVNGLRVEALPANSGVMTCLANDIGYENVYSHQINVKGEPRDLLLALNDINLAVSDMKSGTVLRPLITFE